VSVSVGMGVGVGVCGVCVGFVCVWGGGHESGETIKRNTERVCLSFYLSITCCPSVNC